MTERWPVLIERLASCRTCQEARLLYPDARPLFGRARPERADLLFVLEAPNYSDTFDADKGYLTVDANTDPSGKFFHELHTTMLGEPLEHSVLTNAVLCLPSGSAGRYPVTSKTMANCSPNLRAQVLALEPLIVITVGGKALEATRLIENHGKRKIGDAVAQPVEWFGRTLFPVFHTGLLARNGPAGRSAQKQRGDWKRLREVLADLRAARQRDM